jgi:hypothetical protein
MIMAYNGYGGYYNAYPQYGNTMGYQQFQQPMMQQQMMNGQQQSNEIPFSEMHFGTMKEAEAHIVSPMKSVLFFNRGLNEIYIKSADNMGNPLLETFKKVGMENNSTEPVSSQFDPKDFVKREDLNALPTKDDLKGFLTIENTKNFVTQDDIKALTDKLTELQKQVRINEILKGETNNG